MEKDIRTVTATTTIVTHNDGQIVTEDPDAKEYLLSGKPFEVKAADGTVFFVNNNWSHAAQTITSEEDTVTDSFCE